jgi:hypothetical protein
MTYLREYIPLLHRAGLHPSHVNLIRAAQRITHESLSSIRYASATAIRPLDYLATPLKPSLMNVATSPILGDEGDGLDEDGELPECKLLDGLRQQVKDFEHVIQLKDSIEEEKEIILEQREVLNEHSRRAAALVQELQGDKCDMEYALQTLKKSYDETLAASGRALESQCEASAAQIIKLENALVRQQMMLASLGLEYEPLVRNQRLGAYKVPHTPSPVQPRKRGRASVSPLRNRQLACKEEAPPRAKGRQHQEGPLIKGETATTAYVYQLEDEILNLRVFLSSEANIKKSFEAENIALHRRLLDLEDRFLKDTNAEDTESLVERTGVLSLEEQNTQLVKSVRKDALICVLNSMRRNVSSELDALKQELVQLEGRAAEAGQVELVRMRESLSVMQTRVVSMRDEERRLMELNGMLKTRKQVADTELQRALQRIQTLEAKLTRYLIR